MTGRAIVIGLAAAGLVAASSLPAAAQMDDFLCSTFSFHCEPPPPPPPPAAMAPEAAPEAAPVKKHAHKAHKKKLAKAAKTESEPAAAAPEAAPK